MSLVLCLDARLVVWRLDRAHSESYVLFICLMRFRIGGWAALLAQLQGLDVTAGLDGQRCDSCWDLTACLSAAGRIPGAAATKAATPVARQTGRTTGASATAPRAARAASVSATFKVLNIAAWDCSFIDDTAIELFASIRITGTYKLIATSSHNRARGLRLLTGLGRAAPHFDCPSSSARIVQAVWDALLSSFPACHHFLSGLCYVRRLLHYWCGP